MDNNIITITDYNKQVSHTMKKYIAIGVALLFLATSITIVSAKEDRVVESNSCTGTLTNETFRFCTINSTGHGRSYAYIPYKPSGKRLTFFIGYIEDGTTIIKSSKGTLTIKGEVSIELGRGKINFFTNFLGKYELPIQPMSYRYIFLKGICHNLKVTYWVN